MHLKINSQRFVPEKLADLKLREEIAVKENPDVFISVHVNSIPQEKLARRASLLSYWWTSERRIFSESNSGFISMET